MQKRLMIFIRRRVSYEAGNELVNYRSVNEEVFCALQRDWKCKKECKIFSPQRAHRAQRTQRM